MYWFILERVGAQAPSPQSISSIKLEKYLMLVKRLAERIMAVLPLSLSVGYAKKAVRLSMSSETSLMRLRWQSSRSRLIADLVFAMTMPF